MNNSLEKDRQDGIDAAEVLAICGSFNLRKASRVLTQLFDEALQPAGLRSTQLVTLLMLARDGDMTMSQLSQELVLSPSTLSRNLRPLERRGLISIASSTNRGKLVTLTQEGRETILQAAPHWQDIQERFMRQVGAESWREMTARLNTLVDAVRREEG